MPLNINQCPFHAGGKITDPRFFIGRREPLRQITTRMSGQQPISINLVGESRIGKSSLLHHFTTTWAERLPTFQRDKYVVVHLDMQAAQPKVENAFYRMAAQALKQNVWLAELQSIDITGIDGRKAFRGLLEQYATHGVLPVICLDEFSVLLNNREQFNDSVYDVWRGWMDSNRWMLIVSTFEPLKAVRQKHSLTSRFFNLGHVIQLGELSDEEASALLRLPASNQTQLRPALGQTDQQLARTWAGNHPYKLQLAGMYLWEAADLGYDADWAKQEYDRQLEANMLPQPINWKKYGQKLLRAPNRLLGLIWRLPRAIDEGFGWVFGWMVLLAILAAAIGWLPIHLLRDWFINWLEIPQP